MLLVEDDPDLLDIMCAIFLGAGVQSCLVARSLAEVQAQRAGALVAELAIFDVNLGHGNATGVDVHHWLRSEGFVGRSIFLTGHAQHHPLVRAAAETAGTTIVSKPLDLDHLVRLAAVER